MPMRIAHGSARSRSARSGAARNGPAQSSGRWCWWLAAGLCASLAAILIDLLSGPSEGYKVTGELAFAFDFYQLLGLCLAVRAWRHPDLDRASRRAWGIMALAYLLLSMSGALRPLYPPDAMFPSPSDLLRLAFVPVMLVGLLALPLRTQSPRERYKVALDTIVVVVASAMLLWYVEVGPSVEHAERFSGGALAAAIAYPALDLMLIFGAAVVLFRGAAESARVPAALLGLAMLLIVAGDVYLGHRQSHHGVELHGRWQFACWLSGHFTITMAAYVQCRLASRRRLHTDDPGPRSTSILPYLAVGLSYLLLLLAVQGEQLRVQGLVVGTAIITAVVVVRQIIAQRQNRELAITDPLTGLANRRRLYDQLRLALVRSSRNGQNVATLLLDINGFRHVNDTMGHDAGDQLLVAVGQIMRRNVLGGDVVGRLGADEFAVILHNICSSENAAAVGRRIIADMQAPVMVANTPIQPRAAIGVALSLPGQLTAEELLDDADLAMSWAKRHCDGCVATYQEYATSSLTVRDGVASVPPGRLRSRSFRHECVDPESGRRFDDPGPTD